MKQFVYDLPTRLFHWIFTGLFLVSFVIAQTVDDDSPVFSYHMLSGIILSFAVILRIVWGVIGTKHAKFSGFDLNPQHLFNYFKGILSGDKRRWAGHNPASSWAAIVMMVLALASGVTGYLMTTGPNKETFEDAHELFANTFLIVAILHVLGVVLHTIRHHEMIGMSMVDGKKVDVPQTEVIASSRSGVGLLFLALMAAFTIHLINNYNTQARTLNFLGSTWQLGETEHEHGGGQKSQEGNEDHEHED